VTHSRLASPRATIETLKAHGLYTRKSLGQHFLVDDNVVGRIMDLARLSGDEVVVEVGPGIGTLTLALCEAAGAVVAVERDEHLLPALADSTRDCRRLEVVVADAVAVRPDALSAAFGAPTALVANLPYGVAATLVLRYFEQVPSLEFGVVMVQAEVADRMQATPGTKEYGAYTVKLSLYARVTERFSVSPSCFLPPPRVESAVVRLDRTRPTGAEAIRATSMMADAAFAQRRKTVRNSIRSALGVPADTVTALLEHAGVDGGRRAETLSVEEYQHLGAAALQYGLLP